MLYQLCRHLAEGLPVHAGEARIRVMTALADEETFERAGLDKMSKGYRIGCDCLPARGDPQRNFERAD